MKAHNFQELEFNGTLFPTPYPPKKIPQTHKIPQPYFLGLGRMLLSLHFLTDVKNF